MNDYFFIEKVYNTLLKYTTPGYSLDTFTVRGDTLIIKGQMPAFKFEAFMRWLTEFMRFHNSEENINIVKNDFIKRSSLVSAISKAIPYFSSYYDFTISLTISNPVPKSTYTHPRMSSMPSGGSVYDDYESYGTPFPENSYNPKPSSNEIPKPRFKRSAFAGPGPFPKYTPNPKESQHKRAPSPPPYTPRNDSTEPSGDCEARNHLSTLGFDIATIKQILANKDAHKSTVNKTYRRMQGIYHPDKPTGNKEKSMLLNASIEYLRQHGYAL